jgi:hypothetical protein
MLKNINPTQKISSFRQLAKSLRQEKSGLALVEFAMALPVFLGLGMYGTEVAYLAVTKMQVEQIALNLADNASRMGETPNGAASRVIAESDIASVFTGARLQGERFGLTQRGRIILSSSERIEGQTAAERAAREDDPWGGIVWQRCLGEAQESSTYGGPNIWSRWRGEGELWYWDQATNQWRFRNAIVPEQGEALMFAEVFYNYEGLFGDLFLEGRQLRAQFSFGIRDDRELFVQPVNDGATQYTCDQYTAE